MEVLTIGCDVVMVVTLPLHLRIIYVLVFKYRKINLDPSFHMLMINSCAVNIAYSLIFIFVQEPASAGLLFDFYQSIGGALSKVVQIQSTLLTTIGAILHLVLGLSRLTAIALPLKHVKIWTGRRLLVLYSVLWFLFVLAAIPLLLPGSTAAVVNTNVYGTNGTEFALLGNYYIIYAVGGSGIGAAVELLNFFCYLGMCVKYHSFLKMRSGVGEARKMTRGVLRTTIAALIISVGSWLLVSFFVVVFGNIFTVGRSPFSKLEFSLLFRLLNVINNVLTAWVLIAAFSKVRRAVVGFSISAANGPSSLGSQPLRGTVSMIATNSPSSKFNRERF